MMVCMVYNDWEETNMFWKHFQLILAYLLGHLNIYVRSIMVKNNGCSIMCISSSVALKSTVTQVGIIFPL